MCYGVLRTTYLLFVCVTQGELFDGVPGRVECPVEITVLYLHKAHHIKAQSTKKSFLCFFLFFFFTSSRSSFFFYSLQQFKLLLYVFCTYCTVVAEFITVRTRSRYRYHTGVRTRGKGVCT